MPSGSRSCVTLPSKGRREETKKKKVRNEGRTAAGLQKRINLKYDPHSSLTLSRTCEARAAAEVHALHARGEHDLVDSACGREGKDREKHKVRKEEGCAVGLKTY